MSIGSLFCGDCGKVTQHVVESPIVDCLLCGCSRLIGASRSKPANDLEKNEILGVNP